MKTQQSSTDNNIVKPLVNNTTLSVVYKTCWECYGQISEFSNCHNDEVVNGRCTSCNKFCKTHPCTECGGFSPFEIKIGDEVRIYLYKNSPNYLKEQFNGGRFQKGKFYKGKVKNIINNETIVVKLSTRLINVKIDDVYVW